MAYRAIFLDGLNDMPFIECEVCKDKDIDRNLIEPVVVFVKEKDYEETKSKLKTLSEN